MFGVNFADGRIKGYPTGPMPGQSGGKLCYVLYVHGNSDYGVNDFTDNGSGTITDNATGLMWSQDDSGSGLNWEEALAYIEAQNDANYLGYSDWRLPNVKELQSIVDYGRSPDTTDSAAIDPLLNVTTITNEGDQIDYPAYWSSTTHANMRSGGNAAYVNFGRSIGYMNGRWMDVHGAGAQRSDPKSGDPNDYPTGNGPQGDAIRIYNFVRLVRDADAEETADYADRVYLPVISTGMATNTDVANTVAASAEETVGSNTTDYTRATTDSSLVTSEMGQQGLGGQAPDLATAAIQLGVTEEALQAALGDPTQGPPDFAAAAQALGVTESALIDALGSPADAMPPAGQPNGQPPMGRQ